MLRVGSSDYRQAFPQYLVGLLDTVALPGDQERLQACEARNAELQKRGDVLDEALQSAIELRNEMDRLEHGSNRREESLASKVLAHFGSWIGRR